MDAARAAAALRRRRLAQEHVDLEELGYSRVIPSPPDDVASAAAAAAAASAAPLPPPEDDAHGELVSSVAIPVCSGAPAAEAEAAAPAEEEHVLEV